MNLHAIWAFVAGDSRLVPLGVALAIGLVLLFERVAPAAGAALGVVYVVVIAAGLVAGVFERA